MAWNGKQSLDQEDKELYNVQGLAKALHWTLQTLAAVGTQSDIFREIFHSLHSDLPRSISHNTLQSWATFIAARDDKARALVHEYDSLKCKVPYDLLMKWFLQKHSFILNCDNLLMELRLRYLNTFSDRGQMNEMFDEVLRGYMHTMASSGEPIIHYVVLARIYNC
ncbi:hypothetical protein M378DRAFT_179973 [Amanita muscaria Koide BX008]|uniref:Uncharacterized protein n=1 Tax=Amanita muscaria (strain Koide BX008) TaxID=946122 RepID=A0A0C2SFB8_AMAMK|nr:hypothetical protein M378DRAFT_179973 [Amanita muscaria Koide BX008]